MSTTSQADTLTNGEKQNLQKNISDPRCWRLQYTTSDLPDPMQTLWQTVCRPDGPTVEIQNSQTPDGHQKQTPASVLHEHFRRGDCAGTNNVSVQFLDIIVPTDGDTAEHTEQQLKRFESLWMERLKCEYPQGLNWTKYDPRKRSGNNKTTQIHTTAQQYHDK